MPGADWPDLEERLRRLPAVLAAEPAPGLLELVARQGRRRRRLRQATAAVTVVVLLAAVTATGVVVHRRGGQALSPGSVQDATAAQLAGGRGQILPPNPVADRDGVAVAWTGKELIVWGGMTRDRLVHADGAAYDPATRRWRPLPPAPQAQTLWDGGNATWTGRELLIWGAMTPVGGVRGEGAMRRGDGLAYDPATRTWRRLPLPPRPLPPLARPAVWTGSELLVIGADADQQAAGGGLPGAAYDPLADRWRVLAASPGLGAERLLDRTVLWAGTRLLVWSFWTRPGEGVTADPMSGEPDGVDLWAYDPAADQWTVLAAPSGRLPALLARASLAWTGREVLAVQHDSVLPPDPAPFAGRYHPDTGRWTPIASPPVRVRFGVQSALVWTGAALVANGTHAYDPAADRWWRLPGPGGWTWLTQGRLVRPLGDGAIAMLVPAKQAPR